VDLADLLAGFPGDGAVVGSTEGRALAERLGWPFHHDPPPGRWAVGPVVAWGPLDLVRRIRWSSSRRPIIWRVDGLRLPLTEAELRLVRSLRCVAVADRAIGDLLTAAAGEVELLVVDDGLGDVVGHLTRSDHRTERPFLAVVCDGVDAGDAALVLAQLLRGGSQRCGSCGRSWAVPFEPSTCRFRPDRRCRCGGSATLRAPKDVEVRWAVRNDGEIDPTGACRWLGLDGRVEVATLAGRDWPEVAAWFVGARALLVMTTAIDPPTTIRLGRELGLPTLVPAGVRPDRHEPVVAVGSRTETTPGGHLRAGLDPMAWFEAVDEVLAVEVAR
jgi:hypothetical protein